LNSYVNKDLASVNEELKVNCFTKI